ncbi:tetratricopeptide repeat protein [Spirochaetota bacterium]
MLMIIIMLVCFMVLAVVGLIIYLMYKNPSNLFLAGEDAIKNKKWNQAIKVYTRVLENDKQNPIGLYNLGVAYEGKGEHSSALKYYNYIIEKSLLNDVITAYMVYSALARIYMKCKDYDDALKMYLFLQTIEKSSSEIYYNLGFVYFLQEDHGNASKNFKECIRLSDPYMDASALYGISLYKIFEYDLSLKYLLQSLNFQGPRYKEINYCVADAFCRQKKFKESIRHFELSIQSGCNVWESYKGIGDCFYNLGETGKAIENYTTALQNVVITQSNLKQVNELRYMLGEMYKKMGKINDAYNLWEKIAKSDPGFKDIAQKVNVFSNFKKDDKIGKLLTLSMTEFKELCQKIITTVWSDVRTISVTERETVVAYAVNKKGDQREDIIVEIGRMVTPIGELAVRELAQRVAAEKINRGVFMTLANFTSEAVKLAETRPIELMDGDKFRKILSKVKF